MDGHDVVGEWSLPLAFRGYARDATDALLERLEAALRDVLQERDVLSARLSATEALLHDADSELERRRAAEKEVADALVLATELRERAEAAADRRVARAELQVEAILADADARARAVLDDVSANVEARRRTAEAVLDDTMDELRSVVRAVTARATQSSDGSDAVPAAADPRTPGSLQRDGRAGDPD